MRMGYGYIPQCLAATRKFLGAARELLARAVKTRRLGGSVHPYGCSASQPAEQSPQVSADFTAA
jgi:hypothetical protein